MSHPRQTIKPTKTIDTYFKRKVVDTVESNSPSEVAFDVLIPNEQQPSKSPRLEPKEVDATSLECDPGLWLPI